MGALEQELQTATGVKPKPKEDRTKYLRRLMKATESMEEVDFDAMSGEAQKWANTNIVADDKGLDLTDFDDTETAEDTSANEGEGEDADEPADPEAPESETKLDKKAKTPAKAAAKAGKTEPKKTADKKATAAASAAKTAKEAPAKAPAKTAKPSAAPAKAAAAPKAGKAKGAPPGTRGDGYKGHRAGSRKEQLHKFYDEIGPEKAKVKAEKMELAASTVNTWFAAFKKDAK